MPAGLPCCACRLSTDACHDAWWADSRRSDQAADLGLLPAGEAAIAAGEAKAAAGYRVMKWKVGACSFAEERSVLQELVAGLPEWGAAAARCECEVSMCHSWRVGWSCWSGCVGGLSISDRRLSNGLFAVGALGKEAAIPMALDEESERSAGGSLVRAGRLGGASGGEDDADRAQGALLELREGADDVVWSSVFGDRGVGLRNALQVMHRLRPSRYTVDCSTQWEYSMMGSPAWRRKPRRGCGCVENVNLEELWSRLPVRIRGAGS